MRHYSMLYTHKIWYYIFAGIQVSCNPITVAEIRVHISIITLITEEMSMEEHEELLLQQLESEGEEIAKHRKALYEIINSGRKINCAKLLGICKHLNEHIAAFDRIDAELSRSETIRLTSPKLRVSGL